ncbi:NUDIX domain-containing protein [Roseibium hamelinense]|uniref:NUDIX domain-containing protein n=2 Tax=Roseibium hamelinense TaxID=150831 RepID=A0A562T954_9HYPH|nr:NUDIX domain-containing protein [Roseibium hamelinense]
MIKPWTLLSSRFPVADRWLRLRAGTYETPSGQIVEPFYVQENPEWICVLPITADGEVVCVREYRHGADKVLTGLIGGVVDDTDPSPKTAAMRELEEETGYRTKDMVALGAAYANCRNQTNKVHYYLARGVVPDGKRSLDEHEDIKIKLLPLETVSAPGFLQQSYHLLCLHLAKPHLQVHERRQRNDTLNPK